MVFRKKNGKSLLVKEQWYTYTYETASTEVINDGFKGLARELREVADQIEAANMTILTIPPLLRRLLGKGCGIGVHPLAHVRGGLRQLGRTAKTALERLE